MGFCSGELEKALLADCVENLLGNLERFSLEPLLCKPGLGNVTFTGGYSADPPHLAGHRLF